MGHALSPGFAAGGGGRVCQAQLSKKSRSSVPSRRRRFTIDRDLARIRAELLGFIAERLPTDPEDAEDLTQRVLLKASEGEKGYDRALLFHIARAELVDEYRRIQRHADREHPVEARQYNAFEDAPFQGAADRARLLDPDGDWGTTWSPAYTIDEALFTADFDSAVRGLDEEPRDAFIVGELRGLPSREAGVVLGVSHVTAAARRREATSQLKEAMLHPEA